MSTYLDMILKVFKMDQSKKEFLPEFLGMKLRLKARPRQNREKGRRSSPMLKT